MKTGFDMHVGKDGEVFEVGGIKIKLIHTLDIHSKVHVFLLLTKKEKRKESLLATRFL
jgi:glyoxylase-like metal-dependent hydrolase (beta-lactamase superfamily II)